MSDLEAETHSARGPGLSETSAPGPNPRAKYRFTLCLGVILMIGMGPALAWANAELPREYRNVHGAGSILWHPAVGADPLSGWSPPRRFRHSLPMADRSIDMDRLHVVVPDHPAVNRYVNFYQHKGRRTFAEAVRRSWSLVPKMMDILERYGVPRELVYTVLVESRFQTKARSHRGAAGLWQFMPATARAMGLRVGRSRDERLDPIKSTRAAAKYLNRLYRRFGSWPLALAAYNAGGGAVSKALGRVRQDTFWEIHRRRLLSKQTRQYVPKVLAAIHVMRNLERFGFQRPPTEMVRYAIYRKVEPVLSLNQISQWSGVSVRGLRDLNPVLAENPIAAGQPFDLKLPVPAYHKFRVAYERYGQGNG